MTIVIFIFGLILGFLLSKINFSNLFTLFLNRINRNRESLYLSKWNSLYSDYYRVIKIIESGYTSEHNLSSLKLVTNFRNVYRFDRPNNKYEREIYDKKSLEHSDLYINLSDSLFYHYKNPKKLNKSKESHIREKIKRNRELRLSKLLDKDK